MVKCEPHVRSRLKLVFPKVAKHASAEVQIHHSPENCRDLAWFLDRYPLEINDADRALLHAGRDRHIQTEQEIEDLFAGRLQIPPAPMAEPARSYQEFAAEMLSRRKGLLLADDVGTGKTVTAICSLVRQECLPALIVCPTHMPSHWERFIARFAPHLRVHLAKKAKPYPLTANKGTLFSEEPDVLVMNYHKLRGWADHLAGKVRLIVFDECQQLRRSDSDIYRACAHVADDADFALGLSATPIYNYGAEWFNVIECLRPSAMGARDEFMREWCSYGFDDKARIKDTGAFGAYLRREGLMLRRTRKDIGRELPAVQKIVHEVDCDPDALESVKGDAVKLARIILASTEAQRGDRMNASGQLDALIRQATGIAKAPYVAEFVRLILEGEQRVLLFGWHHAVYRIWMEALADFHPQLYTGQESPAQKSKAIESFTSGESRVLIMSLRSGAGVDGLQHVCRTCVFGELDWSPGVHEQCVGRIDRDGQPEPVAAYFLTANDGSDPIVVNVLGIKREQVEGVKNPDADLVEKLDRSGDHILALARSLVGEALNPAA